MFEKRAIRTELVGISAGLIQTITLDGMDIWKSD
jgi:hypothetical protein